MELITPPRPKPQIANNEAEKKRLDEYIASVYNPKTIDKSELERKLLILAEEEAEETPIETPLGIQECRVELYSLPKEPESVLEVASDTPMTGATDSIYLSSIPISGTASQPDIQA